jgi:small-conductance mechanosensitive channel/CRP-like cAMP-binding protein
MKQRVQKVINAIGVPLLIVTALLVANYYEEELFVRFGVETVQLVSKYFPIALGIGIWFSVAYLINRLLGLVLWDRLHRRVPVPKLLRDVTGVLIYALALTGVVGTIFHKPVGPFWAASGAGAIVIGLALRNVILDIFIGLAVNFDRPFEIGHFVQLANGPAGRVVELNWRTTRLLTGEGNLVVIPNGKLGELIVTNFSLPEPTSEFEFIVCLDYAVSTDRALRVLNAAVLSVAGTSGVLEEPAPKARIRGVSAQGVDYKIKYFIDPRQAGPGKARHVVWKAVLDQLHQAGLGLATPKQDVFHAEMPQRQFDARSLEDRVTLLERVELFAGLTMEERQQLAQAMRERVFAQGEALFRHGDAGSSMFILFEGLLDVLVPLTADKPPTRVARLTAGAFFGEMSAFTGEPRSATIQAAGDSVVFEISKENLSTLILARPDVAETISKVMATRRLRNNKARDQAGTASVFSEEKTLVSQIVGKIFAFFGAKSKPPKTEIAA